MIGIGMGIREQSIYQAIVILCHIAQGIALGDVIGHQEVAHSLQVLIVLHLHAHAMFFGYLPISSHLQIHTVVSLTQVGSAILTIGKRQIISHRIAGLIGTLLVEGILRHTSGIAP